MRVLRVSLCQGRDFQRLGLATLHNAVGLMGDTVALGWLTLELTVGVARGARSLPLMLIEVPAGGLAERISRQRLMRRTGAGQAASRATLAVLAPLGHLTLTRLLALTVLSAAIRALEQAARQSYAHDRARADGLLDGLAARGLGARGLAHGLAGGQ